MMICLHTVVKNYVSWKYRGYVALIKEIIFQAAARDGFMNTGIETNTFIFIGTIFVIIVSGAVWLFEQYSEGMFDA